MDLEKAKAFLSRNSLTIIVGLGVLISLVLIVTTPTFKECIHSNQEAYSHYPPKEGAPSFIGIAYWCSGTVIKESAEAITALATLFIGIFTLTLWLATERSGEHFQVTERAYVKLSHTPPGAMFTTDLGSQMVVVQLQVKNFGHTPAYVTDVYLDVRVLGEGEVLPAIPEYPEIEDRERVEGFLVAEDLFYHTVTMGVTQAQWETAHTQAGRLIVMGYVDYRDKFGAVHRGAYAREYDGEKDTRNLYATDKAWKKRNNLPIITQARYNDDLVIKPV